VPFLFHLRFQSHNFGESYLLTFLGYIYIRATVIDQTTTRFTSNLWYPLVQLLLFHRFEIMENIKRSTEGALDGSSSSRQRTHRQESASCNTSVVPEQTTDSAQLLESSLVPICRQLPRDNDDLIASIGWTGEKLIDCLSIAELALAII